MSKEEIFDKTSSFAAYSLPGTTDHFLIQGPITKGRPLSGSFFAMQSFNKSQDSCHYLLAERIQKNRIFRFFLSDNSLRKSTSKTGYLDLANRTIAKIRNEMYDKVVISRVSVVDHEYTDFYEIFRDLKDRYPQAFVFLYHTPALGCWCGASPEILLRKVDDRFLTMALAGTQIDQGIPLNQVQWGDKEIHEQAIIESFISSIFHKNGIQYEKQGPVTMKAAHVLHILSEFYCEDHLDGLEIAELLHPGPAICGIPEDLAFDWINQNESHDRQQYCGFIGPWGIDEEYALFVNLRSMRIFQKTFHLYLGGGLTSDSQAELEWKETEQKAKTILSVLNNTFAS